MAGRSALGPQLMTAREENHQLRNRVDALEREIEAFKTQVVERAREVRQEQGWCLAGFNAVMEDLGLPKEPTGFTVKVKVIATQEVTVFVDADDLSDSWEHTEAGVREYAKDNNIGYDDADAFSWEIMDGPVEVVSVEAVTD
jgi:hypothetical protein